MDKDTQLPAEVPAKCPECGGLNGGHGNRRCSLMTLQYAQQDIIDTEQKWIKINSLQAKISQGVYLRLKKVIAFNQGKVAVLKQENNKLRKEATRLRQARQLLFRLASLVNAEQTPDEIFLTEIKTFLDGKH